MKKCTNCGAELNDAAKVCRECGESQPDTVSEDNFFSMPYLSVENRQEYKAPESEDTDKTDGEQKKNNKPVNKLSKEEIERITDPRERAFAKQDKRNRMIRIAVLIIAVILVIGAAVYLFTRSTGYTRALEKYIDGRTTSGGTKYLDIVPDIYLLEAEELYGMSRPDIRSKTEGYLESVEDQLEGDFGSGISFTYKIISERETDNESELETIEETINSSYGVDINIDKAAYVSLKLTTKGSETQSTETLSMTFYEYEGKWYSLDAMHIVQYACENAGYGLW